MSEEAAASGKTESGLMARLRGAVRTTAHEAAAAFERTPLEVLLGAVAAVGCSVAVQWNSVDDWVPLLVAVAIALPLTYAASALHARNLLGGVTRWAVSALAVAGGALYGFLVFDTHLEAEAWRAWLLVAAAFAALLCVPLFGRPGDPRKETHAFIARFAVRSVIVGAYAAALWVGLALALAAINGLFELHLPSKAWEHLAAALFILLPPWAVAAGLPDLVAPLAPWRENQLKVLRRVGAFLLAPLVLVYLAIVYAYTVRVIGTGEVPKNLVSPVVIGAGLLTVAMTIALDPVQDDERASGLASLVRLAAPLLLPLVLFAIWAVSARVDQYGWTEFRFLRLLVLVLLACYAAAATYRLIRRRHPPLATVPAVLAVVMLLAAVGPWSATAVARRSQTGELRELLASARKKGAGEPEPVPGRVFRGITDKAAYVQRHFGWATLATTVPWIGPRPKEPAGRDDLAKRIGIVERVEAGLLRVLDARLPPRTGIPGIAGGTLYVIDSHTAAGGPPSKQRRPPAPDTAAAGELVVRVDRTPGQVVVVGPAGDTLSADVAPLMRALLDRSASKAGEPIWGDRPDTGGPPPERGRSVETELAPFDAVVPLLSRDGRTAGQLVLRRLQLEAAPQAGAIPPHAISAGDCTLRLTAAEGFVILSAEAAH